jgi:hypothetical protein
MRDDADRRAGGRSRLGGLRARHGPHGRTKIPQVAHVLSGEAIPGLGDEVFVSQAAEKPGAIEVGTVRPID